MLALKPLVDGFRIIFHIDGDSGFNAEFNFALSRFNETAVESIPQVILQALALAGVDAAERATGQYISLAWSILTIAYTFVSATFMLDTSEQFRAIEPRWYGFIKQSRENAIQLALSLSILGHVCSKLLAVALAAPEWRPDLAPALVGIPQRPHQEPPHDFRQRS